MTKLEALTALRDKVKVGDVRDWRMYMAALGLLPDDRHVHAADAYNGSLDAAKALHESVLPGFGWSVSDCMAKISGGGTVFAGYSDNPARAWLLAILEALIAQEKDT